MSDKLLFGDEEKDMLKYSIHVRKQMVQNKLKEGINNNGDMRVVSETLNGLDSSLLSLAKLDQDYAKNQADSNIKMAMINTLRDRKNHLPKPTNNVTRVLDQDIYEGEILDSELNPSGEKLDARQFLSEED